MPSGVKRSQFLASGAVVKLGKGNGMVNIFLRQIHRPQYPRVRPTAAKVPRQSFLDLSLGSIRKLFQQACDSHQDATDAIATLCRLLFDEGGQHNSTDLVISQALCRLNVFSVASPDGRCASILCLPIDQNGAGATVTTAATKSNGCIGACPTQKMQ
jgi:hypothetical protein